MVHSTSRADREEGVIKILGMTGVEPFIILLHNTWISQYLNWKNISERNNLPTIQQGMSIMCIVVLFSELSLHIMVPPMS